MLRRLFYAAAILSALLLLTSLILWPVSYSHDMRARYVPGKGQIYFVGCLNGRAYGYDFSGYLPVTGFHFYTVKPFAGNRTSDWSYLTWNTPGDLNGNAGAIEKTFLGVHVYDHHGPASDLEFDLHIPFSYLALLFALLPAMAWRSISRRLKAARVGLCPHCHYDLRVHLAGGAGPKCPECGTPIAPKTPRSNDQTRMPNDDSIPKPQ